MDERKFTEGELVLVDVAPKVTHEKWVPALYLFELPTGNHAVKITEDGEQVERAYPRECLKHSDEALSFKVHYEVYVDVYGSSASTYESLEKAKAAADELANGQKFFKVSDPVVVDKVLVGGYTKVFVAYPTEKEG